MCGIFGFYYRQGQPPSESTFLDMGSAIEHRGPDGIGTHFADHVALGNQRLSIIDVEGGGQPFYSDDENIVVVQNGEIYNYIELAKELAGQGVVFKTSSDTEVLLHLYQKHGIEFLSRLNGMFSIAIYDKRSDELFLARDRVGVKPLFVHEGADGLLFASEIKSLLRAGLKAEMSDEALQLFLAYNYVPPPATMFKGVSHLMPGHYLVIGKDGINYHQWWDLTSVSALIEKSEEQWVKEIAHVLDNAVQIRMRADVPFGAFLSGGVDSGTVVGLMSRHATAAVKTYCIGFDDDRFDESPHAEQVSKMFHTEHQCEIVNPNMMDLWPMATYHCDQPHGDVSFLPTYKVSKLAANHVKMVLTGDGGDELFAGYDKYKTYFTPEVDAMPEEDFTRTYCNNISLFTDDSRCELMHSSMQHSLDFDVWSPVKKILERASGFDRINQALLVDMLLLLPGNNLVKPDRMGMAVSLEARTPFLDYRLVEIAFNIPGDLKLKNGVTKYILKKVSEPIIGDRLSYRRKQMFTVPVGEWFKNTMKGEITELLTSEKAKSRQLFNESFVKALIEDHSAGIKNNTRQLRALIAVELWHHCFIDDE
jgi:asparagine synthase (glutamine-hydrolysing)